MARMWITLNTLTPAHGRYEFGGNFGSGAISASRFSTLQHPASAPLQHRFSTASAPLQHRFTWPFYVALLSGPFTWPFYVALLRGPFSTGFSTPVHTSQELATKQNKTKQNKTTNYPGFAPPSTATRPRYSTFPVRPLR